MKLADLDYDLPERLIAQEPLADRTKSRLLVVERLTGKITHMSFMGLLDQLGHGDLLVMNDSRVSAVRLSGRKPTGGKVEALVMRPLGDGVYEAMLKPSKGLRPGSLLTLEGGVTAEVVAGGDNVVRHVRFRPEDEARLPQVGHVPLPPYIHQELADPERYQTVYASQPGSAAAPTAGLHFTPGLLGALRAKGVETATVTLHVGTDTFRPMTVEDSDDHAMHGEWCQAGEETARKVAACRGRIVAVGTTTARTLESLAIGRRIISPSAKNTHIFIQPGYEWQVVEGLLTNFHMPRTTMLLMLASLVGAEAVRAAYAEAVQQGYRFLSFGDAMLVL